MFGPEGPLKATGFNLLTYRSHSSIDDLERSKCKAEFRVEKEDIPRIAAPLLVPNIFRRSQGTICPGEEGLCLLLRRLSYPCCYHDLIHRFGRPVPELCMTTNTVLDWMCHSLISWNQPIFFPCLSRALHSGNNNEG